MKLRIVILYLCALFAVSVMHARPYFNSSSDLLIAQFDSKPDPDDIHAQAALGSMLAHSDHADINCYAVSGAYGIQNGIYLDSDALFTLAFGALNTGWTDADADWWGSVGRIKNKVIPILQNGGKVWVQEAGQSNITADWLYEVLKTVPAATVKANVIVVQHSQWNEDQTASSDLNYVKNVATYYAIDDGNAPYGNTSWGDRGPYSTPEYRSKSTTYMAQAKASPNPVAKQLWTEAAAVVDFYYPGGYPHDWSFLYYGGVDYSDAAEAWWILDIGAAADTNDKFWAKYVINTPVVAVDSVSCASLPSSLPSSNIITVEVPYEASTNRDIVVEFWNTGWLGQARTPVTAGSGVATVTISLANAPAVASGYIFKTGIRPTGGDWTTAIDTCNKFDVSVTSAYTDSVSCASLPASLAPSDSITVEVPYESSTDRDIVVEFWDTGWLGQARTSVTAGAGTASLTIPLANAPAAGADYLFKTSIRPTGGDWTTVIDACNKFNVVVVSPYTDSVSCSSLPSNLDSSNIITVQVPYEASEPRDVVVEFWNTGWLGQARTAVTEGTGTATVTISLTNAPAAGSDYLFKTSIRPTGGNWTTNLASCSKFDVTVNGAGSGNFIEQNGIVIMEAESAELPANWAIRTTVSTGDPAKVGGFTGEGYIEWTGAQVYGNTITTAQAQGVIQYTFEITNPGTYELRWRTKQKDAGQTADAGNDNFIRWATGSTPTGIKDWSSFTKAWIQNKTSWDLTVNAEPVHGVFDVNNFRRYLAAGTHTIELAARSPGHVIDRLIVFRSDVAFNAAQFASAPESPRDGAAPTVAKFDFGTTTSPLAAGYTRITAATASGDSRWTNTSGLDSRDRATGGDINRDIVFSSQPRTFTHNVANGTYDVTVTLGDTYAHDDIVIKAEGVIKASNIDRAASQYADVTFSVTVSDGALDLEFSDPGGGASGNYWIVNAIEVSSR